MTQYFFIVLTILEQLCIAADVLFLSTLTGAELSIAESLSLTADILDPAQLASKTTSYFEAYKAIIIGSPAYADVNFLAQLVASRKKWSPAITGNIILIGTT